MKTKETIVKARKLFLAKNSIEDWNDNDTKDCMDKFAKEFAKHYTIWLLEEERTRLGVTLEDAESYVGDFMQSL